MDKNKLNMAKKFYKRYSKNLYIGDLITYKYGENFEFESKGLLEDLKYHKEGYLDTLVINKGDNYCYSYVSIQDVISINNSEKEFVIDHRILGKKYNRAIGILIFLVIGYLKNLFI